MYGDIMSRCALKAVAIPRIVNLHKGYGTKLNLTSGSRKVVPKRFRLGAYPWLVLSFDREPATFKTT